MKSILLLSFLLPTLLFSQITHHFSNQDSKWHVAKSFTAATQEHPSFVATTTTVFGIQGDSTINSEVWSKIYSTSDSSFQNNLVFEGLTRVDNDLILYKNGTNPIDTLYNFDLAIGDSVFYDFDYFTSWIHVYEIETVLLNGESYRKFIFTEPNGPTAFDHLSEVWIEGIGSVHGPLFPNTPTKFSEEVPDSLLLTCSFSNNQDFFQHPSYSDCYVNITLGIKNQEALDFSIYPNPVSSILTIESTQNINGEIEFFDVNGKLVKTMESFDEKVTIDVSGFENGVYFLHFDVGSGKVVKKVLVGE
ncbi:T9SS type A sorting domain-containing protein [Brumimicrobium aurantiacum]|uniref:T9SS C-terminal target domain-containing protein n=1 Tax=Brumimicrobium aurantiacum TaxID=1737063 RepID=A0A3E1F080_9FLAO|nr:T9SS type A sorting domain-containing protein [Brumimicrobium aurantiacum]RFC55221.1 T9SS C-terminal target domain-containing protein [Brumimicrobium aurantiacum]